MIVFTGLWLIGGLLLAKSVMDDAPTRAAQFLFAVNCVMLIAFVFLML